MSTDHLPQDENVETFRPEDWICVDGQTDIRGNTVAPVLKNLNPYLDKSEIEFILRQIGHYSYNGGLIAFVNKSGQTFIGPYTRKRILLLQSAGYHDGGVIVPFGVNGIDDQPADENIKRNLERLRQQAEIEKKEENIKLISAMVDEHVSDLIDRGQKLAF